MENKMFHQGRLQDGISQALDQNRVLLCFVSDNGPESRRWETEFFNDREIFDLLNHFSVALQLPSGSQEAGYLEELFPVPKKPTVIMIKDGALKEYIACGDQPIPRDEFVRRVKAVFPEEITRVWCPNPPPSRPEGTWPTSSTEDSLYDDDDSNSKGDSPAEPSQSQTSLSSQNVPQPSPQPAPQPAPPAQEPPAAAERPREDKGKAKAKSDTHQPADQSSNDAKLRQEKSHAEEVKRRRHEANLEKKRVLKRIEDDKRARKQRDAEERRARELLSSNNSGETSSHNSAIPLSRKTPSGPAKDHCSLQIRLLDGSTIRNRFPSAATLAGDVRNWIDEERTDGDTPYAFRILLTPQPNKAVEPAEESESLLSLGLPPSATLILVPVKHTSAYASASGPLVRLFSSLYGAIMASVGGFWGLLFGRRHAQSPGDLQGGIPMDNIRNSRVRGFQNPEDRRRDQQFYNGNSLSFEPRRDDDDHHDQQGQ